MYSSDIPYKVSSSTTKVYYVSLHKALLHGYKIKVTVLDARNGQKLDQITLGSDSDVETPVDVQVEARGAYPIITWADKARKNLKVNVLGSKAISTFPLNNEATSDPALSIVLHSANDVAAPSHVVVEVRSQYGHWGEVLHVQSGASSMEDSDPSKAKVKIAYGITRLAGEGTFTSSLSDGKLFFTRIAKGAFLTLSSAENKIVEHSVLTSFGIDGTQDYPAPVFSAGEISQRADGKTYNIRAVTFLDSGDLVLVSNGHGAWTRHEGLAYIVSANIADLPKKESLAQQLAIEDHASVLGAYIHRVGRHINDLRLLPKYLQALPDKIKASIAGTSKSNKDDLFGFHKFVIVLTQQKRLIALDMSRAGRVVWSNSVFTWKTNEIPPVVISPQGLIRVETEGEHVVFNSTNGKQLRKVAFEAPVVPLPKAGDSVVKYTLENGHLTGSTEGSSSPLWTFIPRSGEEIRDVTARPSADPVASIGDVLGDRRVLYKYLNPNAILVTAANNVTHTVSFYLIDAVSGNALYATTHNNVDTSRPIPTILSENWLAYSFTIFPTADAVSRGYQLTLAKLYESSSPDDRGPLGSAKNFSSLGASSSAALQAHVRSQTFQISEEISHLSVTQTRQGITSRLLLGVLPFSGSMIGIPLPALDPRRPVNRDPTKIEAEEGLFRYTPNLEFDPKWILSHRREVLGLQNILAVPATLESTSLLFAWGQGGDVFGTRIAPSFSFDVLGKDFNKVQMLLTVAALGVGVVLVAPLVARKGNNMRWTLL